MEKIKLAAKKREKTQKRMDFPKFVPAILYGKGMDSVMLWVDNKQFTRTLDEAGESTIIDLDVDGIKEPHKVLVYDVQNDPISDAYTHIDFFRVKMDEEIETEVELEFIGESPAVKEKGGVLVRNIDSIEVRCLPGDLPGSFTIDISTLKTFDDYIYVKDIQVSDKVKIDLDGETVIALVAPPRSEEELEELESEVDADISGVEGIKEEAEEKDGETEQNGQPEPASEQDVKKDKE